MKKSILILLTLVLTSCATSTQWTKDTTSQNEETLSEPATIYVLRPKKLHGAFIPAKVYEGQTDVGRVANGGYLKWTTQKTHTRLKSQLGRGHMVYGVDVTLKPGETYFYQLDWKVGWFRNKLFLKPIAFSEGQKRVAKLKAPLDREHLPNKKWHYKVSSN